MSGKILLAFILVLCFTAGQAQTNFWTDRSEASIRSGQGQRKIIPKKYRTLSLDTLGIRNYMASAPTEFSRDAAQRKLIVTIPMPDGSSQQFSIVRTEMMEPALAEQFPDIRTYGGQGIDDRTASIKIDIGPRGFHAQILSPVNGSAYIDPYANGDLVNYIAYFKKDLTAIAFREETLPMVKKSGLNRQENPTFDGCIGDFLRTYRLAIACTGEYAVAVGANTEQQALAAIVTSVNRVNGVYETELDVRLILVATELNVIFVNPATDPFTQNDNGGGLLGENQRVCDSAIGNANYDIGHCFSTGGGGVAGYGVVCSTGNKAIGVTGLSNPTGDAYDIDYVAHEMGHQFGGGHTFNCVTGSCNGNRSGSTAGEPGSGTTIMAYAGICGAENDLQPHSDAYFHGVSFDEMLNFIVSGGGNSCPVRTATGNHQPVINAGLDHIIPKSTPFILTGTGTDPDGDALMYSWDEMDVNGVAGDWNNPAGNAPLFRFYSPTPSPTRYFPKLSDVINNTTTIGEILPNYARTINMRLIGRDNRAGGGGICWDQTLLTVEANAGPFLVLTPNTAVSYPVGTFMHVKWDVARTNLAPVNCDSVVIELSKDGGLTFPIVLSAKTLNDGDEDFIVPNEVTTTARVRVRAQKNVFYDMSNVNFSIVANTVSEFVFNDPADAVNCSGVNPSTTLLTAGTNGFATNIILSATGNPAGTTVSFSSNPVAPGSPVTVTLVGTVAPGDYSITVTGTAGAVVKSKAMVFSIRSTAAAPVLTTPANNTNGTTFTPTFTWQAVSGATGYNLAISTDPGFSTIIASATDILATTYTLSTPLAAGTDYYWRVSTSNSCGAGTASGASHFITAIVTCPAPAVSTNVPVIIPTAVTTVTSNLTIAGGGVINDVDVVGLKGNHTYVGDLTFRIKSPANTTVLLFGGLCDGSQDFDMNLDDEAPAGAITCPLNDGQVRRPVEALSAFDNQSSTGTWTLSVSDGDPADGGALTGWGLRICTYSATVLPVNWLSFTAEKNSGSKSVLARWQTASELNNHHYELERSADGRIFTKISTLNAGNGNGIHTYLYNDMAPLNGDNYYRVKQVDIDGGFTYSGVVKIVFDNAAGTLWSIYPNPAKDHTSLKARTDLKNVWLRLTDAAGKLLYRTFIAGINAGESIDIPMNGYARGMYLLTVNSDQQNSTEKIIVQ